MNNYKETAIKALIETARHFALGEILYRNGQIDIDELNERARNLSQKEKMILRII